MALSVCLPLIAGAQNFPDAKIDFAAKGERLEVVFDRLEQKLGWTFNVDPTIADEIMVIDVHGVQPLELLFRIAEVSNAVMSATTKSIRFERTQKIESELREASIARRAKAVSEYLAEMGRKNENPFGPGEAELLLKRIEDGAARKLMMPAMTAIFDEGPASRLAHRLLATIAPRDLVGLGFMERRVFAYSPTKLQYGFGEGAAEAYQKYVAEQNDWANVAQGRPKLNIGLSASNPYGSREPVADSPTEWAFVVRRSEMATPLFANLVSWGQNGREDVRYQVILPDPAMQAIRAVFSQVRAEGPNEKKGLFAEISGYIEAFQTGKKIELSQETRALIMEPDVRDMVGAGAAELLAPLSGETNLVALVGDEVLGYAGMGLPSAPTDEQLQRILEDVFLLNVESKHGWTLVSPIDPHLATQSRTPRKALKQFLQTVVRDQKVSLDPASAFISKLNEPSLLGMFSVILLGVPGNEKLMRARDWHAMRLYGLLTGSQKMALGQGSGMPFAPMSADMKAALTSLALSQKIDNRAYISDRRWRRIGQALEPTELLTAGISPTTMLFLQTEIDEVTFAYRKRSDGLEPYFVVRPESIATYEKTRGDPGSLRPGEFLPDAYAAGRIRRLRFRIKYTEENWQEFQIVEDLPDLDAEPAGWQSLPDDIVEKIKKLMGG